MIKGIAAKNLTISGSRNSETGNTLALLKKISIVLLLFPFLPFFDHYSGILSEA